MGKASEKPKASAAVEADEDPMWLRDAHILFVGRIVRIRPIRRGVLGEPWEH